MRTLKGRIQEPDSTRTQLRGDFRREKSLGGSKMRSNMRRNDRYHLQFTMKVERKNRKKKMKWPEIRIVVFVWLRGCVDNQIHYLSAFIVFFVRTLAQTTCNHTIFEKHRWINRVTQRRQSNPLSWQSFVFLLFLSDCRIRSLCRTNSKNNLFEIKLWSWSSLKQ